MKNFPLPIDDIIMCNKNWVELVPKCPNCDIIFKHFLSGQGKKGPTFKSGKTLVQYYILNKIYAAMLEKREANGLEEFKNEERETIVTMGRIVADFMVHAHTSP